jgi:translation initiation factor eIF-2B subunit epsilon
MSTQTKSKIKMNIDSNVKTEDILQAVIIGDSFNTRFAPITHFKPRVRLFSYQLSINYC